MATQIKQGSIPLEVAWTELAKLQKDPFISTVSLAEPLRDYDALIAKNSTQLSNLENSNPEQYKEITAFHVAFQQPPAITAPNATYYGRILAINASDGKTLWEYKLDKNSYTLAFNELAKTDPQTLKNAWETAGWQFDAKILNSYLLATGNPTDSTDKQAKKLWALRGSQLVMAGNDNPLVEKFMGNYTFPEKKIYLP